MIFGWKTNPMWVRLEKEKRQQHHKEVLSRRQLEMELVLLQANNKTTQKEYNNEPL